MTTLPSYNKFMEVDKALAKTSAEDFQYWTQCYAPAVEFARAAIRPDMSDEEKQTVLYETLKTMQKWTQEP